MLHDLFVNGAIVIAALSMGNHLLINQDLTPSAPWKLKIFFSSMSGLLGILLMINSVEVMPGVILDFRNIAIVLSATYSGFVPAIITALIIGIFRLLYGGISFSSIIGALTALIIGFSCGFINILEIPKKRKWIYMGLCILIIPPILLYISMDDQVMLLKTLLVYSSATIIVLIVIYYYVKYIDLLRLTYREYQRESVKDYLTGLNNVRQFDNKLNKVVANLREDSLIILLFIDIDFFKKVNDTYGHQNGDKVLEDLGKILLNKSSNRDFVSRNGGEEFSVLITDCPRDKIKEIAERIRKAVQEHKFYLFDGQIIHITVSIGVAVYPDSVTDIEQLVEKADEALYEAKRTGRNKVVLSGESMSG